MFPFRHAPVVEWFRPAKTSSPIQGSASCSTRGADTTPGPALQLFTTVSDFPTPYSSPATGMRVATDRVARRKNLFKNRNISDPPRTNKMAYHAAYPLISPEPGISGHPVAMELSRYCFCKLSRLIMRFFEHRVPTKSVLHGVRIISVRLEALGDQTKNTKILKQLGIILFKSKHIVCMCH